MSLKKIMQLRNPPKEIQCHKDTGEYTYTEKEKRLHDL